MCSINTDDDSDIKNNVKNNNSNINNDNNNDNRNSNIILMFYGNMKTLKIIMKED